jgi:hypothetical protein
VDGANYLIPVDAKLERDTDVYDEVLIMPPRAGPLPVRRRPRSLRVKKAKKRSTSPR